MSFEVERARSFLETFRRGAPADVLLVAVSKTQAPEHLRAVHALGLTHFGENYLQEALQKIDALRDLPLCWHFIGPLQSNKTRAVAESFSWVHSVDRLKLAERLSAQRPMSLGPLNVLIQVNVSGEESKSGVAPQEVPSLAQAISALPSLRLRGLMAIPEPSFDEGVLRARFHALKELLDTTNSALSLNLDTLSMGMSSDYALAIEEGSTLVRIGSALFGERPPKSNPEVANEPIQS